MGIHKNRLRAAVVGVLAAATLAACSSGQNASSSQGSTPEAGHASKTVKLVYVEWSSCTAATHVVQAALEQQGYKVDALSVSGAAMYSAIANGDADATVCAWLPSTQANYYARTKDKLDNLGPNMAGTKIGLVVPDYVSIDSIDQLAANADKFQDQIIGIDPGAGEMGITQKAIADYKLPLKLVDGSGATMTAALKNAIDNHQWIVVTGWTPHWMWARWKLKYLADPQGVFGHTENIDTLARKGLKKDMPGAWRILDGFHWTPAEMQQVMAANQKEGADPAANAGQWVKAHPQQVAAWVADTPAP
ncbi:glycine betaine ABC transporter substrate-binding protein [Dyella sp. A6]|uniref:glycine betaine ABC transporter substrate-binding protein n=1 Tax=Dyella aluminiiresistens TaxID=3069105 RepID=UPI002E77A8EC|nr:glycine betaine ABC transporter substrate-binding protein [Dyella sp. A6]